MLNPFNEAQNSVIRKVGAPEKLNPMAHIIWEQMTCLTAQRVGSSDDSTFEHGSAKQVLGNITN